MRKSNLVSFFVASALTVEVLTDDKGSVAHAVHATLACHIGPFPPGTVVDRIALALTGEHDFPIVLTQGKEEWNFIHEDK